MLVSAGAVPGGLLSAAAAPQHAAQCLTAAPTAAINLMTGTSTPRYAERPATADMQHCKSVCQMGASQKAVAEGDEVAESGVPAGRQEDQGGKMLTGFVMGCEAELAELTVCASWA